MPLSMEAKQLIKKSGYSILAWALKVLIAQEQRMLAAMIIVALCLAPRKTKLEDNGVRAVLRNKKLRQMAKQDDLLMCEVTRLAEDSRHYDKIEATLVAAWWWSSHGYNLKRRTDPILFTDDSCMIFGWDTDTRLQQQDELCDHAGCQREREFPHFRLVLEHTGRDGVRVIGRQMGRWQNTAIKCRPLPNGYLEYRIPSQTVLYRISDDIDGRTLEDVLKPGVWYNYHFQPDTELELNGQ